MLFLHCSLHVMVGHGLVEKCHVSGEVSLLERIHPFGYTFSSFFRPVSLLQVRQDEVQNCCRYVDPCSRRIGEEMSRPYCHY